MRGTRSHTWNKFWKCTTALDRFDYNICVSCRNVHERLSVWIPVDPVQHREQAIANLG